MGEEKSVVNNMVSQEEGKDIIERTLRITEKRFQELDVETNPKYESIVLYVDHGEFKFIPKKDLDTFVFKHFNTNRPMYEFECNSALFLVNHFDYLQQEIRPSSYWPIHRRHNEEFQRVHRLQSLFIAAEDQCGTDLFWSRRRFVVELFDEDEEENFIEIFKITVEYEASQKKFVLCEDDLEKYELTEIAKKKIENMAQVYFDQPSSLRKKITVEEE